MPEFHDYVPPSWDKWFMQLVYLIATKSKDTKTKIGAVIVKDKRIISTGFNGLPCGVNDAVENRFERPIKYLWTEHGERNAIYAASKHGISTEGASIYTSALPCSDCSRGIIQSGIKKVYIHKQFNDLCDVHERAQWKNDEFITPKMYFESNIELVAVNEILGCKAYFDGKVFDV